MIGYCIEVLYHFRCRHCEGWWTIGDWQPGTAAIRCPHCGTLAVPRALTTGSVEIGTLTVEGLQ